MEHTPFDGGAGRCRAAFAPCPVALTARTSPPPGIVVSSRPSDSASLPPPTPQPVVDAGSVRRTLADILASPAFQSSERLRTFLEFIVDETLEGRGGALKEFTIGSEVCQRGADYDPRVDPVVRVEARRLRARLADYYDGPGRTAAVRIEIPKGAYVPVFHVLASTAGAEVAAPARPADVTPTAHSRRRGGLRRGRVVLAAAGASLVLAIVWVLSWRATGSPVAALQGIAVIPFTNASAEPSNEFVAFGLTEDVTAHLVRIDGLRVVSRSSTERFRGPHDAADVARQLRVRYLLEGSVRRAAARLRVTAQLVDAATGATVWGEAFDRDAGDVFGVQDELTEAIAAALVSRLSLAQPAPRRPRRPAIDREAYAQFLEGQYLNQTAVSPGGRAEAVALLEASIARDARHAPAHLELAAARATEALAEVSPPMPIVRAAQASIARALALDPSSAEGLALRAWLTFFVSWDWNGAEQAFREALRLNASSPTAHHRYALLLMTARRFDEAIAHADQALDLDPLSHRVATNRAVVLLCAGRPADAERQARAALELSPGYALAHVILGSSLAAQAKWRDAEAAYRAALAVHPRDPDARASLARLLALTNRGGDARAILASFDEGDTPAASRYQRAFVLAALGEADGALALLDEAIAAHETELVYLAVDPLFDPLRHDPRLAERLARVAAPVR